MPDGAHVRTMADEEGLEVATAAGRTLRSFPAVEVIETRRNGRRTRITRGRSRERMYREAYALIAEWEAGGVRRARAMRGSTR